MDEDDKSATHALPKQLDPPLLPTDDAHSKCATLDSQGTVEMDSQQQDTSSEGKEEEMPVDRNGVEEGDRSRPLTERRDQNFPSTLEGFGYEFRDGRLVNIETGGPFEFEVKKGDRGYNQRHYEALGEVITDVVYGLLETYAGLERITIPKDHLSSKTTSFIFASDGALSNPDKLMVLIHGSGVVRAGQWARRLIINDGLSSGTQLPFIMQALGEGYGVVVLNTNRNHVEIDGTHHKIPGSSTPEQHGCYVWKHFIKTAKAKRIDIVAHSYGGIVTVEMLKENVEDFRKRVNKIAFTDSAHHLQSLNGVASRWIKAHARNWVSSRAPLDTKQSSFRDVPRVSAGTPKHEETSWCAFQSIFAYFNDSKT